MIMNMIGANFAEEMDSIKRVIKQKAENAKISGKDGVYQPVNMYPVTIAASSQIHGAG